MHTVAIVGRPNVGKSTLFNRLVGRRIAIVHDTPGVTRDRKETVAAFDGRKLRLVDTAGFEEGASESLSTRMTKQTIAAIAGADAVVFVLDARDGITTGDEEIARALRRAGKPVILVANKTEGRIELSSADAYALGFGEPLAVSAEHNLGTDALTDALLPYADEPEPEQEDEDAEVEDVREDRPLRLAIVGRPNVGKSSLFNRVLGEERALTSPEAGTTRDAIAAPWKIGGREVLLYDTAGMRRKARAQGETLELLSISSALDAIRFADCVIVVMDITQPFEKQDLAIADLVEREGRAVVFAFNKWDLVENRAGAVGKLRDERDYLLPQLTGAPLLGVSALTGEGVDRLPAIVMEADRAWNSRQPTAALNRFLEEALARHAPPTSKGRRIRIRYMTQAKSRPPTFALFGTQLKSLPEDYLRYLQNALREAFKLQGAPIRLLLRTPKNPYDRK
jgi:GTP-binding protein